MKRPKLGVLVSGTGSLLEAMIADGLPVSCVIADRQCRGLNIAEEHGLPWKLVDRKDFGGFNKETFDRDAFTRRIAGLLRLHEIDLVAMAGFMTFFTPFMFEYFRGKIMNTHPSLLPSFKGDSAVADALQYGVKITGCTIHWATEELDAGPIIAQRAVPVYPNDTVASLHERIKGEERGLYPEVIRHELQRLEQRAA